MTTSQMIADFYHICYSSGGWMGIGSLISSEPFIINDW